MIFSVQDMELLRLLWWCGNASPESMKKIFDEGGTQNLVSVGLICRHKGSGSLCLTEKGRQCLLQTGFPGRPPLSYRKDLIERRVRVSEFVVTAYRARLKLSADMPEAAATNGTVFLPSLSRGKERNVWGSSRIAALLYMGNCCYGVYPVYPSVGRINLEDEEKTLAACASRSKSERMAFLFAGDASALTVLERADVPSEGRLISYGEAQQRTSLPVHLLSCDDTGAVQLQIMSVPDYRRKLTRAALKSQYQPPDHPAWDALFQGMPFVMAADMDLRRLDAAVLKARQEGHPQIAAAALEGQAEAVLFSRYRDTGKARVFILTGEAVADVTGRPPAPYAPPRTQFLTAEGDVIDAPPFKAPGRAGRQTGSKVRPLG